MAWIISQKATDAGQVRAALSQAHQQASLMPFLTSGLHGSTERPWDQ